MARPAYSHVFLLRFNNKDSAALIGGGGLRGKIPNALLCSPLSRTDDFCQKNDLDSMLKGHAGLTGLLLIFSDT